MSEHERARLKRWLYASEANTQAYIDAEHLWDVVGSSLIGRQTGRTRRRRFVSYGALATAASIALIAVILAFQPPLEDPATPWQTNIGEIRAINLADGSRVTVNTASAVVETEQDGVRSYSVLAGEAFFEVAHEDPRPFVVSTEWGDAIAIGTAFGVRSDENGMIVSVSEGIVEVVAPHASTRLTVDEQAHVHEASIRKRTINAGVFHAWRDGSLVFEDVKLDEVLERISRYSSQRIAIGDGDLADLRVTAVLTIGHPDDMLNALGKSLDLRWKAVSERLILVTKD